MGSAWHIVAFPVILPWRDEFWTLPLYFPDLQVGVIPGWPEQLPYQGMPLPSEAEVHPRELQNYNPGELRQWQAFADYRRDQDEAGDNLLQAIRGYGKAAAPEPKSPPPNAWSLAWQLEKMQADQEAKFLLVDQGQDWLQDILKPEPWRRSGLVRTRRRGRRNGGPRAGQTALPPVAPGDGPRDAGSVGPPAPGPRLPAPVPHLERLAGVDCPPEGAACLTLLPQWGRVVAGCGPGWPAALAGEVYGSPGGPAHGRGREPGP